MKSNQLYTNYIIYFFSTCMIVILFFQILLSENNKEGFNVNDVVKKVEKNISNKINKIEGGFTKKINNIDEIFTKKLNKVEDTFTKKLKSVFKQIGDIFMNAIVKPLISIFIGIKTIFIQLFNIMKKVTNKIVTLPSCLFTYLFKTTIDTIYAIYASIIPKFIRSPISTIYKYTLRYIVDFISYRTGYDASVKKCYGFNVDPEIDKMNDKLQDINKSFSKGFGNLDFSKIKV